MVMLKNLIFTFMFINCICLHATSKIDYKYINPFENQVLSIKTSSILGDEVFNSIKTSSNKNIENKIVEETKFYFDGKNLRLREYMNTSDLKNVRDLYLNNGIVYLIDSINTSSINIVKFEKKDVYRVERHIKEFLFLFENLKKFNELKNSQINVTNSEIILTWFDDKLVHKVNINKINFLPNFYESRFNNGDLHKTLEFTKKDSIYNVREIVYNGGDQIFSDSNIEISIINDCNLKEIFPKNFGFRIVYDYKTDPHRIYYAVDNLPSDEFLDELFKNPDDVVRYNKEMSRFNTGVCNNPSHNHNEN